MNISITDYRQLSQDYPIIEQAIQYLEKNARRQPELSEVAAEVGLSEFHFQRVFTRWAGISPKRFLQFVTKENAKEMLDRSENLLDTTLDVGLSSLGRLHDLFVATEAVTPGEYKSSRCGLDDPLWPASNPVWSMPHRRDGAGHLPPRLRADQRRRRR